MKERSKTPERELSDKELTNLSDGEFKILVIKILTELIELGRKMKEPMTNSQSEIKQNIQGINGDRKETRTQINDLEQKEGINIQPEHNEDTRIQKYNVFGTKDGNEVGGNGVHFPLHMGETPSQSTKEQREQPTVPQHL